MGECLKIAILGLLSSVFATACQIYPDAIPKNFKNAPHKEICARSKPTALYLNFYINTKKRWMVILFGKDEDIGLSYIRPFQEVNFPHITSYALTENGFKETSKIDEIENMNYQKSFDLNEEENKFLRLCLQKAMARKIKI